MRKVSAALLIWLLLVAPGAAQVILPGGPPAAGCAYNSVLPTLLAGQFGYIQCDSNGRLIISNPGGGGGGGGGQVYGYNTPGTAPSGNGLLGFLNGYVDAGGLYRNVSPTTPFPTNLAQVGGAAVALGQTTASASIPVTLANNAYLLLPNAGSVAPGTAAAQSGLAAGVYNTTPPAPTNGQQVALQLNAAGALKTDASATTQPVSGTFFQATQPVSLIDGADTTLGSKADAAAGTGTASLIAIEKQLHLDLIAATPAGTLYTGQVGASTTTATGGVNSFSRLPSSAATTNATVAKASTGRLYKIVACNTTTTPYRIKFYNVATTPTPGTTTVAFTRPIPAAGAAGGLACATYDVSDVGWYFSTGISWATTQGAADTDTTALTAGQGTDISVEYQ